MPNYYLITHPETVVSIVKNGKIPDKLPSWAHIDYLSCTKISADCFSGNTRSLHQIFILELEFPMQKEKSDDFMLLKSLSVDCIQRISVYSSQGENLLNNLLGGNCSKPIVIQPSLYPLAPKPTLKRPPSDFFKEKSKLNVVPSKKETRMIAPIPSNVVSRKKSKKEEKKFDEIRIGRLGTHVEHIKFLQSAFREAKKSILITSFDINHDTLENAGLYKLISDAVIRKVRICFYYNDQHNLNPSISKFLKENGVSCEYTYTHSKILAVDKHFVAAGSFNWLSATTKQHTYNDEGSLYIRGEVCNLLIEDFWNYIKYYRNEQFGNSNLVDRFENNPDNMASIIYELDNKTELNYLPTLEEHSGFLQESFEHARQRIIICSPFISAAGKYKLDLSDKLLTETIARGVEIYFICLNDSPSLKDFALFLDKFSSPKIHLIPLPQIHLKTIIVDEDIIAEGSFNWLSATRDRESDYHNHEQTLLIKGSGAAELIEHFFKTRVGEAVLKRICEDINEQTLTTRSFI